MDGDDNEKGVESVFRVSSMTILRKENIQQRVVEHTRRREGERKVLDHYFSFVFMLIYNGLRLNSQMKVDGRSCAVGNGTQMAIAMKDETQP